MHVLLFDIDGTLIDSGGAGRLAMETALAEEFGITTIRPGIPYAGRTDWAIAYDLLAHHGHDPSQQNQTRLMEKYLGHLPRFLVERNGWVLPGVKDLLTRLQHHPQITLGLLTGNVRAGATTKLRFFGLDHFFVTGGFADGHSERDDVARTARAAVDAHLGRVVEPQRVWVIGDTPADVQCARAIGARVIAVATGTHTLDELHETRADHVLADLSGTQALLNVWEIDPAHNV